jgi:hypothetical protein
MTHESPNMKTMMKLALTTGLLTAEAIEWDHKTFTEAGMVGVWTRADSVTLFDDFAFGSK